MQLQTNITDIQTASTTLVVGFFREEDVRKGYAYYRGKYRDAILNLIDPQLVIKYSENDAVGYVIGKDYADEQCYSLHICDIRYDDDVIMLEYIVKGRLGFDSRFITGTLRRMIPEEKLCNGFLPVCSIVETSALTKLINEETALSRVKPLRKRNDWKGIYDLFSPVSELPNKPNLWDNIAVVSQLSFATAKLSEVYVNLKHQFKDDNERKKFLAQKRKCREETIMLRKRCIELDPLSPGHHSNLGYTHYQHVRELLTPGGRRDGNIKEEAQKAIESIDKALELDPQRVTDLYRKGQLLCKVMPSQKLFAKGCRNPDKETIREANEHLRNGIECYERIREIWQILPVLEDKMTKRYQKEYVKSLYNLACAYGDLGPDLWDAGEILEGKVEPDPGAQTGFEKEAIENIDKALSVMEECCAVDNPAFQTTLNLPEPIVTGRANGFAEGVFKLYNTGKLYLQKYHLLKQETEEDRQIAGECLTKAGRYLEAALKFKWSPEQASQSKDYIAERLGRVLILLGRYKDAADVIRAHMKKFSMYYIRYTLAVALIKSGRTGEAMKELQIAMQNERSNAEMWKGYYIRYAGHIEEGNYSEALECLKKADEHAKGAGKKSVERLAKARVHMYKSMGDEEKYCAALTHLRQIKGNTAGAGQPAETSAA